MSHWIWEDKNWPKFDWDAKAIQPLLSQARLAQGRLLGILRSFSEQVCEQLSAKALMDEMITTSAIEGEIVDRDSVRSSIYHRLGIGNSGVSGKVDRYVEGLLDVLLDATEHYKQPLDLERMFSWHAALFPTGYSGIQKILIGQLRGEGDMKIVSGRGSKVMIHYVAPPHEKLESELKIFLKWFNVSSLKEKVDGLVRAGIAHLWFEKIHPFDDGNGRIGRAIIDMALAQDENLSMRFYSISSAIMDQRKGYYRVLDEVSKGGMDITVWLVWFLNCFIKAIETAEVNVQLAMLKSKFWQMHETTVLNERQKKVLNKMLDLGVGGFVGGMTTRKYMSITKVSRATAYRELNDLVEKKCIKPLDKKGRSSAYEIIWSENLEADF